jgi:hypothetical protein
LLMVFQNPLNNHQYFHHFPNYPFLYFIVIIFYFLRKNVFKALFETLLLIYFYQKQLWWHFPATKCINRTFIFLANFFSHN